MLDLFLSRASLKKQKSFKSNLKKIIISTIVILVTLGGMATADFFICNSLLSGEATKIDEDTKMEIEETEEAVLSYEKQITETLSFYKDNYDNLSYELKNNFELEFDELDIELKKYSDEEVCIIAKYKNYDNVEFILKDNKFEKFEEEKTEGILLIACVCFCILIDLLIIAFLLVIFLMIGELKKNK